MQELVYVVVGIWVFGGSWSEALNINTRIGSSRTAALTVDGKTEMASERASAIGNDSCNSNSDDEIYLVAFKWQEVGIFLTIVIFVIFAMLSKIAFHFKDKLSRLVPESCVLVILGAALGVIMYFTAHNKNESTPCHYAVKLPQFSSFTFFFVLLPPIVLESAYSLHDRIFRCNLGTILAFAFIGTLFNIFTIGPALYGIATAGAMGNITFTISESLVFSSLISAVDPVAVLAIFQDIDINKDLYFLICGESLFNDGVAVVVYNKMQAFISMKHIEVVHYALAIAAFVVVVLGGITIGIFFGCITAFITKFTSYVKEKNSLYVLKMCADMLGEPLELQFMILLGRVKVLMVWKRANLIPLDKKGDWEQVQKYRPFSVVCKVLEELFESKWMTFYIGKIFATSEAVTFMFLGMVLINEDHIWHTGFVLWSIFLCFVIRFIGVFLLTGLMNTLRIKKIGLPEEFIIAYAGLRGAVAFSLVIMLDEAIAPRRIFVTTTLVIILFTVFLQGITIRPLVNLLHIQKRKYGDKSFLEVINDTAMDHISAGVEEIIGHHGRFYFWELLDYFSARYLGKWLLRIRGESDHNKRYCQKIALLIGRKDCGNSTCQTLQNAGALQKAFRDHPFNKLHYKYSRNLVGNEPQELLRHWYARVPYISSTGYLPSVNPFNQATRRPNADFDANHEVL
ncbi:sodium/hydrogen exchanger 2-like [Panulirus ornatus]|uniref:sodium/hydrogen exchanger 2-like n=1 Tax=Panulirus ornatus TaxID=150431 RepID=UPI003A8552A5